MGQAKWDQVRREVYESTGNHCAACGVHKSKAEKFRWMEAHEIHRIDYGKGVAEMVEIVPLCHFCHMFIHSGLTRVRARKKEIKASEVQAIMQHGCDLLRLAKSEIFEGTAELCDLVRVDRSNIKVSKPPRRMAPWGKWRLIWDGEEYKGRFKSYEHWARSYR